MDRMRRLLQATMAERPDSGSTLNLLARVSVELGFGLAFYFVVKDESREWGIVGFTLLTLMAAAEIAGHVRQRRQLALFGALPLRLETAIPRLGGELAGAFDVALSAEQIQSAWVGLTCSRVHPATGDSERSETELWTRRTEGTLVGAELGCTVTFAVAIPSALPRSTYTPGMLIRDKSAEFDEWQVSLEVSTKSGRRAAVSQTITVFASESLAARSQ
jgi:hypothetical protein